MQIVELRPIEGHKSYMISSNGSVWSNKRNRWLTNCPDKDGYLNVSLTEKGKTYRYRCHRLVAQAFLGNTQSLPQVNHKDGDKINNEYTNLEWTSAKDNIRHSIDTGLRDIAGEKHYKAVLSRELIEEIRVLKEAEGLSYKALGQQYNMAASTIRRALLGITWK